jgi:hypothetical protein
MLHSITGITIDQIQLTIYTLDLISDYYRRKRLEKTSNESFLKKSENDGNSSSVYPKEEELHDLSACYVMLLDAIDSLLLLVINEMFSTRMDINYWDRMQKGSSWELALYKWNSVIYKAIFSSKDEQKNIVLPINNKHDMIFHIESLKDDFNNLAILLAKLNECVAILREITVKIDNLSLFTSRGNKRNVLFKKLGSISENPEEDDKETTDDEYEKREVDGDEYGEKESVIIEEDGKRKSTDENDDSSNFIEHMAGETLREQKGSQNHGTTRLSFDIPQSPLRMSSSQSAGIFLEDPHLLDITTIEKNYRWEEKIRMVEEVTRNQMIKSIQFLVTSLNEHLPMLSAINSLSPSSVASGISSISRYAGDMICENPLLINDYDDLTDTRELVDYSSKLCCFFREFTLNNADKNFPFELSTKRKVRRPGYWERYWVRNLLLTVGGIYASHVLYSKYLDGSLQKTAHHLADLAQSKFQEHVIEPVAKLFNELFHTIRSREHIVSRKDYEMSRDSLERMLNDFSKSKEGHDLIMKLKGEFSKIQGSIRIKDKGSARTASSSSSPSTKDVPAVVKEKAAVGPTAVPSSSSTTPSSNDTDVDMMLDPGAQEALAALMREYEIELQTPIRGIVSGNLLTAMLIQVRTCSLLLLLFDLFVHLGSKTESPY